MTPPARVRTLTGIHGLDILGVEEPHNVDAREQLLPDHGAVLLVLGQACLVQPDDKNR